MSNTVARRVRPAATRVSVQRFDQVECAAAGAVSAEHGDGREAGLRDDFGEFPTRVRARVRESVEQLHGEEGGAHQWIAGHGQCRISGGARQGQGRVVPLQARRASPRGRGGETSACSLHNRRSRPVGEGDRRAPRGARARRPQPAPLRLLARARRHRRRRQSASRLGRHGQSPAPSRQCRSRDPRSASEQHRPTLAR